MKQYVHCKCGFTLIELLVTMLITLILLSGMVTFFSQCVKGWTSEKTGTRVEQTSRIAMDAILAKIRYAHSIKLNNEHSLTVFQPSGEINTFQLGNDLHENTLYIIINKQHMIPAEGYSTNPITENIVTSLVFTPYPDPFYFQAIIITLVVTDPLTGKHQTLHTAGYPWNLQKTLL
jgi:prepilin-type N-terminal cleavage/methylation domain-containing protein